MNDKGREPRDRPQQALRDLGSRCLLQGTIPSWQTDSFAMPGRETGLLK